MSQPQNDLEQLVHRRVVRIDAVVWALTSGLLAGLGLLVATLWLVVQDGPDRGKHLGLLGHYFPGYEVTWMGGLIGFVWAFVTVFTATWLLVRVYNLVADLRQRAERRA